MFMLFRKKFKKKEFESRVSGAIFYLRSQLKTSSINSGNSRTVGTVRGSIKENVKFKM